MNDWLGAELWRFGGVIITVGSLINALVVMAAAIVVSSLVGGALGRLRQRVPGGGAALYVAGQIGRYIIIFIGLMVAASTLGINLTSLSLFAGALGVGVGLGLQDIVRNFMAGIVLLLDRSVEVGDFVELETGIAGEIASVGSRATTLVTNDNVDVLIPNATLLSGTLTNWTRNRATRRIHVPFAVAYGSDKEKVREAAIEAAHAVPFTLPDEGRRRTQVWLVGFGDSSLNFELVVWPTLEAVKRPGNMMAAYCWAIDDALRKHGIEIPFPQRDVRVRSFFGRENDAALHAWRGEENGAKRVSAPPSPSGVNDAASEIGKAPSDGDE